MFAPLPTREEKFEVQLGGKGTSLKKKKLSVLGGETFECPRDVKVLIPLKRKKREEKKHLIKREGRDAAAGKSSSAFPEQEGRGHGREGSSSEQMGGGDPGCYL